MKLAVIMFDDVEDRVNTQQCELNRFIDENNKVMFVTNTNHAVEKIGDLNLSYNYLYFQDLGYIIDRNGLFVDYAACLDSAVTLVSKRENINDCNIYILAGNLDSGNPNFDYHVVSLDDKFADFYNEIGEIDSFIKSLKY